MTLTAAITATASVLFGPFFICATQQLWLSVRHSIDPQETGIQSPSDQSHQHGIAEIEVELEGDPNAEFVIEGPTIELGPVIEVE